MAIVGKFVGSYGLAAVSNASQITHFATMLCLVFGAVVFAWPRQIFAFFNQEPEVLELAPVFISAALWSYPAMAMMRAGGGFLHW